MANDKTVPELEQGLREIAISMASAGLLYRSWSNLREIDREQIEAFLREAAALADSVAQARERERCAKKAEEWTKHPCNSHENNPCCHARTGQAIANAIREGE